MAVSKRIQVLLKPLLTEAVENLAEEQGETLSRMTAILVEEALTARGLNPKTNPRFAPQDMVDAIQREATASERGWTPSQGKEALDALTPEWSEALPDGVSVEKVSTNTHKSDEAQLMKLKLMQELMEQLKSM